MQYCKQHLSFEEQAEWASPQPQYALQRYLEPLVRSGAIRMTLPDKPRSHRQQFIAADSPQQ